MSSHQYFDIVYAGAVLSGFTEQQVKANFANHLKLSDDKIEKLFSAKRVILKKAIEKDRALIWQKKLLSLGAESVLVPSLATASNVVKKPTAKQAPKTLVEDPPALKNLGEYDEQMQQRINKAKAMIVAQQMEQSLNSNKQEFSTKRLWVFSAILIASVFAFYFYVESIA